MIAEYVGFFVRNLPALLFVVALGVATARRAHGSMAEQFLRGFCYFLLASRVCGRAFLMSFFRLLLPPISVGK